MPSVLSADLKPGDVVWACDLTTGKVTSCPLEVVCGDYASKVVVKDRLGVYFFLPNPARVFTTQAEAFRWGLADEVSRNLSDLQSCESRLAELQRQRRSLARRLKR